MDSDTERIILGAVMIAIGLTIGQYFAFRYGQLTFSAEQIRAWNFTRFPSGPVDLCRDQSLSPIACGSELWPLSAGIYVGEGIVVVGVIVLLAPLIIKAIRLVDMKAPGSGDEANHSTN